VKIAEIRQKSTDELKAQVKKIHEEHFNLRFRRVTDVIENPQALRELRRDLARIHTVVRQRAMDDAKKSPVPAKAVEKAPAPVKAESKKPVKAKAAGKKKAVAKDAKKGK
jgi:large subunit ribosomal protein L29